MKESTMIKWQAIISECESSGLRNSEYFALHNIPPSQYYKYRRLLGKDEMETFEEMQVVVDQPTAVALKIHGVPIEVDADQLRTLIDALQ